MVFRNLFDAITQGVDEMITWVKELFTLKSLKSMMNGLNPFAEEEISIEEKALLMGPRLPWKPDDKKPILKIQNFASSFPDRELQDQEILDSGKTYQNGAAIII